jgi:type II secretory pathway component PulC
MRVPSPSFVVLSAASAAFAVASWLLVSDMVAVAAIDRTVFPQGSSQASTGSAWELESDPGLTDRALEDFPEILERPVFTASRRPPERREQTVERAQPLTVVISGILITPDSRMALVSSAKDQKPLRLRVGDAIQGWKVVEIDYRRVVIRRGAAERVLDLRIEAPAPDRSRRLRERPREPATGNATAPQP